MQNIRKISDNEILIGDKLVNLNIYYDLPKLLDKQFENGLIDANTKSIIFQELQKYKQMQNNNVNTKANQKVFTLTNKKAGFLSTPSIIIISVAAIIVLILFIISRTM